MTSATKEDMLWADLEDWLEAVKIAIADVWYTDLGILGRNLGDLVKRADAPGSTFNIWVSRKVSDLSSAFIEAQKRKDHPEAILYVHPGKIPNKLREKIRYPLWSPEPILQLRLEAVLRECKACGHPMNKWDHITQL